MVDGNRFLHAWLSGERAHTFDWNDALAERTCELSGFGIGQSTAIGPGVL
jgi:hypothetical protein